MLGHTLLLIFIILAILIIFSPPSPPPSTLITLSPQDIVYVDIVHTFFNDPRRISYEVDLIKEKVVRRHTGVDIECLTGDRVNALNEKGVYTTGVDTSKYMIRDAKQRFENVFIHGEYTPLLFQEQTISHVTCLNYNYAFIRDKDALFQSVHHWLEPEGLFIVHIPSPWKYGSDSSKYTSSLVHQQLRQTFVMDKTYKMNRPVYAESKKKIIDRAEQHGFKVYATWTLPFPYDHQIVAFASLVY